MESLSCGFEGRALLFADDTDFVVDGLTRSRNLLKKWDGEDAVDNIGFIEPLLLSDTISSSFLGDQCLESNGDDSKDHSPSPASIANNEKCVAGNLFSVGNSVLSSPEPSMSAKRAKVGDSQSPVPTCQVYGCNKDLSSSKDYHKRHKVCDVHSKTAVVIVNGIRQRFCQQCSRFHILAEFDEGKRSCRKRLAGHNERRRKPQFNTYLGSTYFTTDASQSLFFSGVLSDGFFGLQCNDPTDHSRHLMVEEEPLAVDVKLSQSLPKSVLRFHGMGKQYPSKNCLNAPSSLLSFNEITMLTTSSQLRILAQLSEAHPRTTDSMPEPRLHFHKARTRSICLNCLCICIEWNIRSTTARSSWKMITSATPQLHEDQRRQILASILPFVRRGCSKSSSQCKPGPRNLGFDATYVYKC